MMLVPQLKSSPSTFVLFSSLLLSSLSSSLHAQVMDNLLVQISGRKRVVLFSPRDAAHLYLLGDKSQVLDIDTPDLMVYPHFAKVNLQF